MNMMKSMIWAQVAALASLSLFADTQKVGNYTWTYRIEGGKAEIYSGSSYTAAISPWPEGHVDIPSTLGGKPVTKIGNSAFYYCEKLAYVSIPDSVTSIGACAFDGCALEELTIPDGVTEIGTSAFDGCHSLRSVTLGSDVTSLARRSFAYCTNLTSIVFRGDAPGITADTFDHVHPGCAVFVQRGTSGWGVGIPGKWNGFDIYYNGINEEWVDGYRWTFRIRNGGTAEVCGDSSAIAVSPGPTGALTIPATLGGRPVTYVTGDAFPGCTGLTDVALPYSVIGMGNYAFQGCAGLTTARVPILFLTRNLNTAFYDCPSVHFRFCGTQAVDSVVWHYQLFESADPGGRSAELRNIDVNSAALMPTTRSGPLLIPSEIVGCTVRCIGRNALIRCKNLRSMSIPSTVTNIDSYAFAYCESLRAAVVPGDVKGLGDFAYAGCTNLASVTISTNVTVIRDYTFFNCTSLAKINLPDSVRKIDSNAFYGCSGLASVTIPNSVTNIGSAAFRFCGTLTDVRIPDSVEKIGYYAFADCASLTNVSIPKALNGKIHASVFAGCPDNLTVTYRGPESDVTFIVSGGVFSGSNFGDMDGKSGTVVMTLEYGRGKYNSGMRAERDGAAFAGWWTARDGGTPQYDANGACIPGEGCWNSARQWSHLGNAKLYARLGEPHHPTFYSNGGYFSGANFGNMDGKSGILQLYVTCGKGTYNSGMRATMEGSRFLGWWTEKTGGEMQYDANGKFVPGSKCWTASGKWRHHYSPSLYAHWEADEPHNLKFDSNGGVFAGANFGSMNGKSGTAQISVTCGKGSYNSGMRATRSGYTFQGWWTAASGGSMQYDANGKYVGGGHCWTSDGKWQHHGNAALYARWAADEPHTLKFDPNGGVLSGANFGSMDGKSGVAQVSVTCGKGSYSAGMRATKAGATFKGWWTAPTTGGSMQYDANGKFVPNSTCWDASGKWKHHGNALLYARWQ